VSIEDRVRAATRARADLVTRHRPLDLPAELHAAARPGHHARRWLGWGAPFAAAALVIVLAVVLVVVRQTSGSQPGSGTPSSSTGATSTGAAPSIPRYFVTLAYTGSISEPMKAVVGDYQTGRQVAVLNPSSTQNFYGVTGAADDRTFVVMNYTATTKQTTFYLLRVTPGDAHPAQFTKLPISPVAAHVNGLALSPDGTKLAVMWRFATTSTNQVTYLSVYSVSTGALLDSYLTHAANDNVVGGDPNSESLSWVNGDRSLDFRWAVHVTQPPKPAKPVDPDKLTIRGINLSAAGHDLLGDSRQLMVLPPVTAAAKTIVTTPCSSSLTTGDGTIVCGSQAFSGVSFQEACTAARTTVSTYSPVTGKQLNVLYRYPGTYCLNSSTRVLWANSTGSLVIVRLSLAVKGGSESSIGYVFGGHLIISSKLTGKSADVVASAGGIAF